MSDRKESAVRDEEIVVRVDAETLKKIEAAAETAGRSVSDFVRETVLETLDRASKPIERINVMYKGTAYSVEVVEDNGNNVTISLCGPDPNDGVRREFLYATNGIFASYRNKKGLLSRTGLFWIAQEALQSGEED